MNSQAPRLWCGHFKHQRIGHKGPLVHENTFGGLFQSCPAPRRAALQIPEPNGFTSWRREHILQNKQKNQDAIVYPDLAAELQASIAAAATAWEGITAQRWVKKSSAAVSLLSLFPWLVPFASCWMASLTLQPSLSRRTLPLQHFCLCHARSRSSASADPLRAAMLRACLPLDRPPLLPIRPTNPLLGCSWGLVNIWMVYMSYISLLSIVISVLSYTYETYISFKWHKQIYLDTNFSNALLKFTISHK